MVEFVCLVCREKPAAPSSFYCAGSRCPMRRQRAIKGKLALHYQFSLALTECLFDFIENANHWGNISTLDSADLREIKFIRSCFWDLADRCGGQAEAVALIRRRYTEFYHEGLL